MKSIVQEEAGVILGREHLYRPGGQSEAPLQSAPSKMSITSPVPIICYAIAAVKYTSIKSGSAKHAWIKIPSLLLLACCPKSGCILFSLQST